MKLGRRLVLEMLKDRITAEQKHKEGEREAKVAEEILIVALVLSQLRNEQIGVCSPKPNPEVGNDAERLCTREEEHRKQEKTHACCANVDHCRLPRGQLRHIVPLNCDAICSGVSASARSSAAFRCLAASLVAAFFNASCAAASRLSPLLSWESSSALALAVADSPPSTVACASSCLQAGTRASLPDHKAQSRPPGKEVR